jgi:hypothetical protein
MNESNGANSNAWVAQQASIWGSSAAMIYEALIRTCLPEWSKVCARIAEEQRGPYPPLLFQQLLVSGEDHRHGFHPGFDPIAIARALWRRMTKTSREGASTIEQQLVRVITGRYERTLRRKVKEILLAILVSRCFPRAELPAVYLRIAYYGWRMQGFSQACDRMGINPSQASIADAARLVARLKYPQQDLDRFAAQLRLNAVPFIFAPCIGGTLIKARTST